MRKIKAGTGLSAVNDRRILLIFCRFARPYFAVSAAMITDMTNPGKRRGMMRAAFSSLAAAAFLGAALVTISTFPADARGGHGFGGHGSRHGFGGRGMHGAKFSGGRRHGNDAYAKAASAEIDRLLNTRIKSICRGC